MINFKEEILKYEPILEIDNIEEEIHKNELQDIYDLLLRLKPVSYSSRHKEKE